MLFVTKNLVLPLPPFGSPTSSNVFVPELLIINDPVITADPEKGNGSTLFKACDAVIAKEAKKYYWL